MAEPLVRFHGAGKTYGGREVVHDLSFDVLPGRVVGLLGRNGAGKTTSLRMMLGLVRPSVGSITVFGRAYRDLADATRRVGVSMDGIGFVRGATARRELQVWATSLGVAPGRVDAVLDEVGLTGDADRKVRAFSTGMRQRLGLACALLSEPDLLVLDEPANGLDPDGIRWLRDTLRRTAGQGRSVLLCSHLLSEVEQTVDDVLILQQGRLLYSGTLDDVTACGTHRLEERFFSIADAGGTTVV